MSRGGLAPLAASGMQMLILVQPATGPVACRSSSGLELLGLLSTFHPHVTVQRWSS